MTTWAFLAASMRPGDFSPGNVALMIEPGPAGTSRFNEAGGFLPRKRRIDCSAVRAGSRSFNEAGGFLPRKRSNPVSLDSLLARFNEAGGFLPRKLQIFEHPAGGAGYSLQ